MELSLERVELRFAQTLETAYGVLRSRELIEVTLTDDDGLVGLGEAAPLEPYDGVSVERVERALEGFAPVLAEEREMNGAQLIDACRLVDDLPAALARTGALQLVFCLLFAGGILASGGIGS